MAQSSTNAGAFYYNRLVLGLYDAWVLRLSCNYAWKCPADAVLLPHFGGNLSNNHLDVGVGTGYFPCRSLGTAPTRVAPAAGVSSGASRQQGLDAAVAPRPPTNKPGNDSQQRLVGGQEASSIVLVDLNARALATADARIRAACPNVDVRAVLADALHPLTAALGDQKFQSISAFLLIHCLPRPVERKVQLFQNLRSHLADDGLFVGATILGRTADEQEESLPSVGKMNWFAHSLMMIYNALGVFDNWDDTPSVLEQGLRAEFEQVETRVVGRVFLFRATRPKNK